MPSKIRLLVIVILATLATAQCRPQPVERVPTTQSEPDHTLETVVELAPIPLGIGEKLKVVATTSIVADIVKNVGGDLTDLTVLLPVGSDPHAFEPTPHDLANVADAHVVFANGLGLEAFLAEMLENAGGETPVVAVSRRVETRQFGVDEEVEDDEEGHHLEGVDPHVWMIPLNAVIFVHNIKQALIALDPANAETYEANAEAYKIKLEELDAWVEEQIETIPAENRQLVTDHDSFGYYVDRYGLELVGAVIPAFSTNAQPSAQELVALQNAITKYGVKAVFVSTTVNPVLSERVAEDTGIKLVPLYTGSLGEVGSGAETYLDFIRYNTKAIVEALQ
jgi:manganese/iron transport system substrate-binding protein